MVALLARIKSRKQILVPLLSERLHCQQGLDSTLSRVEGGAPVRGGRFSVPLHLLLREYAEAVSNVSNGSPSPASGLHQGGEGV